jgi:hypothetical protein
MTMIGRGDVVAARGTTYVAPERGSTRTVGALAGTTTDPSAARYALASRSRFV